MAQLGREQANAAIETMQSWMADARERMDKWNRTALTFIRERPGLALAGAVALGFLVGRLAARR